MVKSGTAVKAFIVDSGKLLIIKRAADDIQMPGIWEIPGGRLEKCEDPKEGLKRETKEETGISIEVGPRLNTQSFVRQDGQKIIMHIFLCRPLTSEIILSKEHTKYEWIQISDCKSKLAEFFHKEVDVYNKLCRY